MNRAVPHCAFTRIDGNLNPGVDHPLDFGGNLFGQPGRMVILCHQIDRIFPVFVFSFGRWFDQRPKINPAGHAAFEGNVIDIIPQRRRKPALQGAINDPQDRGR